MNRSLVIQSQLLATKFFVPTASGTFISRPRLMALLDKALTYPLTLLSAPAGFGKTMVLSAWTRSLSAPSCLVAWLSLDEDENDPHLFWTYILSALDQQQPEHFTPLLKSLQSPQAPSLHYVLASLINRALESPQPLVLILDDYHVITEPQIHMTLSYLVEHLPPQLHMILATRSDPPLPLSLLRSRRRLLEIRTDLLRCTKEETKAVLSKAIGTPLPDKTIQEVTARTEGWLVGLQLLALSLPEHVNPLTLLQQVSGEQRYILDYLTQVILQQQSQEVQTFLLSTCILERLTAPLCDAVMQQRSSQQMLEYLEQGNLFIVALDDKRQWYRYHALFAETLSHQLERTHPNRVPQLHTRASHWYAQQEQTGQAILHALRAKAWPWAADLIEQKLLPLASETWGASQHEIVQLRNWLELLPVQVVHARPQLCLASSLLLLMVASSPKLSGWLEVAEKTLRAERSTLAQEDDPSSMIMQQDLLGAVLGARVSLMVYEGHGEAALDLSQQALALISPENAPFRAQLIRTQMTIFYATALNNAPAAIESGQQALALAQAAGLTSLALSIIGTTALYMQGAGLLHQIHHLAQQARQMGMQDAGGLLPDVGAPTLWQAEVLREWNQLDAASSLAKEALGLCEQSSSMVSLAYLLYGYAVLLRIALSQGELETARSALQQFECLSKNMNQPIYRLTRSLFTASDQVRLWLACGELDRATRWVKQLGMEMASLNPFVREREAVACVRVFLAQQQPALALQRLEPMLQRATQGQRWGHVIEIHLLQALAHQKLHEEPQALAALSEAVRLGKPEGYLRSFVNEGAPMIDLLSKLREQHSQTGPTPYLDTLLAAFAQQGKTRGRSSKTRRKKK